MINPNDFAPSEMEETLSKLTSFQQNQESLDAEIKKYFDSYDTDENNSLDRKELRHFLTEFFGAYHIRAPITDEYVDAIFREIDSNRDNKIQLEELLAFARIFVTKMVKLFTAACQLGGADKNVALADQSPAVVPASYADEEEKKSD